MLPLVHEFVRLDLTRNRGWPWPESSFGLEPMFGKHGWCRSCGTPSCEQSGSLVLQARGLGNTRGTWTPNWQFDVICVEERLAARLEADLGLPFRSVVTPKGQALPVRQLVVEPSPYPWYHEADLHRALVAAHGSAGARCDTCGRFRWLPLDERKLPTPEIPRAVKGGHIVASMERFGDGMKTFRHLRFSRQLAGAMLSHGNCDFAVVDADD